MVLVDTLAMDATQRRILLDSYDIQPEVLDRLLADIWSMTAATIPEWVQSRHGVLQKTGLRNDEIWQQIQTEMPNHRFAAAPYTSRQIRRMIYG